ncbi:MAG: hypothetical protein WD267_07070 [Balneolales bacterium]
MSERLSCRHGSISGKVDAHYPGSSAGLLHESAGWKKTSIRENITQPEYSMFDIPA